MARTLRLLDVRGRRGMRDRIDACRGARTMDDGLPAAGDRWTGYEGKGSIVGHRYIHTAPARPALVLPEVQQTEFSILDSLIDDYMAHEAEYRPRLDAPKVACGTSDAGSGFRQWHSEYEAVGELLERHEMRIVGECWDRLGAVHNQALRLDYMNRRSQAEVWRNPRTGGMTRERLHEITVEAKRALKADLRSQGVKVDADKREA